jgi:hypothetical protein
MGSCFIIVWLVNVFSFVQGRRRPHNPLGELVAMCHGLSNASDSPPCCACRFRRGGTRLNLLGCLVLVCVVIVLALPAIQAARESARQSECSNNLRNFAMGLQNYHDTSLAFPYGCVGNPNLPPSKRWSWYLCVGNHMQHYGSPIVHLDKSWDAEELRPLMLHTWSNGVPPPSGPYTDMGG